MSALVLIFWHKGDKKTVGILTDFIAYRFTIKVIMPTTITRTRRGKSFSYTLNGERVVDAEAIERIQRLAIPPAWRDVQIATSPRAKVQATGFDGSGRKQAIYNPNFRLKQEKLKFDRILRFAHALPKLRKVLATDLERPRYDREKVLATIVTLIDQAFFRVGGEKSAREAGHYGITTLRSKHLKVKQDAVVFDFVGKSGKSHHKIIRDRQLARIIRRLDELPGQEIFRYKESDGSMHDIHASDVNAYIKAAMGEEFSAKDFRTWGGTLLALTELLESERGDSETARKRAVSRAVKRVSKRLGNTPAVCRASYIDPRIIKAFDSPTAIPKLRDTIKTMRPHKYMTTDEQAVLQLLT